MADLDFLDWLNNVGIVNAQRPGAYIADTATQNAVPFNSLTVHDPGNSNQVLPAPGIYSIKDYGDENKTGYNLYTGEGQTAAATNLDSNERRNHALLGVDPQGRPATSNGSIGWVFQKAPNGLPYREDIDVARNQLQEVMQRYNIPYDRLTAHGFASNRQSGDPTGEGMQTLKKLVGDYTPFGDPFLPQVQRVPDSALPSYADSNMILASSPMGGAPGKKQAPGPFVADNSDGVPPIPPQGPTSGRDDRQPDLMPPRAAPPAGTLGGIAEAFRSLRSLAGNALGLDTSDAEAGENGGPFLPDDGVPPIPPNPHTSGYEGGFTPFEPGSGLAGYSRMGKAMQDATRPSLFEPPLMPTPPPQNGAPRSMTAPVPIKRTPAPQVEAKKDDKNKWPFPIFGDKFKNNPMLAGAFRDAASGNTNQAKETERANQAMMQALMMAQAKQQQAKPTPLFGTKGSTLWG